MRWRRWRRTPSRSTPTTASTRSRSICRSGPDVHLSIETSQPLGTAGAIGQLRPWLDGRAALVVNADTWHRADLAAFVAGWDGERVRILSSGPLPFGARSGIVASILPWSVASQLEATPSGLWECVWRAELEAGRLDVVSEAGPVVDCGTPVDYLAANMMMSGGRSVVAMAQWSEGTVERCVVWSGARVEAHEHLVDAIRTGRITVFVRPRGRPRPWPRVRPAAVHRRRRCRTHGCRGPSR